MLSVEVFDFIRPVMNFESPEKMVDEINHDIKKAKAMIKNYHLKDLVAS